MIKISNWRGLMVIILLGLIAACEPLAPNPQSAPVIIITATYTPGPPMTPTSPLAFQAQQTTPLPTFTPTIPPNPTATLTPCDETEGKLFALDYESRIAGERMPYYVYLPPCYYQSGRRYPYVILLHGAPASGYDYTQWAIDLDIKTVMDEGLADPVNPLAPMIVVMPEGGYLEEENLFEFGVSFEDLILQELIPEIETFCTWENRDGRAIGGISRGGFWAYSIGLRNPNDFAAIGGHSPWFVEDNAPPSHNPLDLAAFLPSTTHLRLYLDNAQNDGGAPNVIAFANIFRQNGVAYDYEISATGGHDNTYWNSKIRDYLNFYGRNWAKDVARYPTCF